MFRLILIGVLSSAFFSATFVLNEVMSIAGGHWLWSASLRYVFMLVLLTCILYFQGGWNRIRDVIRLFFDNKWFWLLAGSVGFGAFYALLCFSADFSPGWVIAATWQFTVVASLFVFMLFGRRFPARIWLFSSLIFIGVCIVNLGHIQDFSISVLVFGGIPVLIAGFCYPLGNQLVWEAVQGQHRLVPHIESQLLGNTFNKVFLLSLGSLPLWLILIAFIRPPWPDAMQVYNTGLVALLSGVCATGLFLYARNQARNSSELAAVDATQSVEVIFALLGGMLLLRASIPTVLEVLGLMLVFTGLTLFIKYQPDKP